MKLIKSELATKAVEVGRKNRKTFTPKVQRGLITEPFYSEAWWYEPFDQYKGLVPQEALQRVELLRNAGIPIKGLVIAHEAPLALLATTRERQTRHAKNEIAVVCTAIFGAILTIALLVFSAPVAAAAVAVPTVSSFSIPLLLATAVLVDPCLIVILDDGTWLEVCRWDESYG